MAELAPVARRLTRRAWLAAFLCAGAGLAAAQGPPLDTERQVKAAYLVKFAGSAMPDAAHRRSVLTGSGWPGATGLGCMIGARMLAVARRVRGAS